MRVNIFSCLLALILSWNVTAEIIHEVVEEKNPATLPCPHPVEGDVTWSRETNGHKVDILTAGGDGDIRHNDPGKRFSSQADEFKSLHICRVTVSDSGRYFCNNEPAVDLTVIPSGTLRLQAPERTNITLSCPPDVGGSDVPTWSRDAGDIRPPKRFIVSTKTLTIKVLKPRDSGFYYCDGKPAAYLTVTRGETSDGGKKIPTTTTTGPPTTTRQTTTITTTPTPTTTPTTPTTTPTTTTPSSPPRTADSYLWQMCVRTVTGILYLIIMIGITVTAWRKAQQIQKRLTTETEAEADD